MTCLSSSAGKTLAAALVVAVGLSTQGVPQLVQRVAEHSAFEVPATQRVGSDDLMAELVGHYQDTSVVARIDSRAGGQLLEVVRSDSSRLTLSFGRDSLVAGWCSRRPGSGAPDTYVRCQLRGGKVWLGTVAAFERGTAAFPGEWELERLRQGLRRAGAPNLLPDSTRSDSTRS